MGTNFVDYPARVEFDYPESPSRWWALSGVIFLKWIALIPHLIVLGFLGIVAALALYIGYWGVLITGRYPVALFNFQVGVQRWSIRTTAWYAGFTDRYPPFTLG